MPYPLIAQGLIKGTLHNANATESKSRLGTYVTTTVTGEPVQAFIPPPLPPNPPLELGALYQHLDRANQALGRLDGLTTLLPDTKFFVYLYIRKEALLSSQIEGTQSSFSLEANQIESASLLQVESGE
jgi:cell filamentation protein, protein adenylyltransferase